MTISEKKFILAMVEAMAITQGDIERAISLIKAQVVAEYCRVK